MSRITDRDPKVPPYSTRDKTSFAYISARDRWPVILTSSIDGVHRAVAACEDEAKRKEGKTIIENIAKLKYEVQHNRALTSLPEDGLPDIAGYNQELESLSSPTWFNVPWLYAECYLYRRLHTLFALSHHWRAYDTFSAQKLSTFKSSRPAVLELATRYHSLISQFSQPPTENPATSQSSTSMESPEYLLFSEILQICLWGNATDLSLLTSLSYADIQALQGSAARKASEKNILANDLPAAFSALKKAQEMRPANAERRVDIVLDNAGFELFVDLVLAGYLLASGLATTVVLRPKIMPWFVSDVIPADFAALLSALADPQAFYTALEEEERLAGREAGSRLSEKEVEEVKFLFDHWSTLHSEGKIVVRPHGFWTEAGSFWRMEEKKGLWEELEEAELVVYKGDLNYRKLTGDVMWPPTAPFTEAIGPLGPRSGMRTLALRTCKADVVVGLRGGEDERLRAMEGGGGDEGRKWAWSGKWAVVQFCDGKSRMSTP